MASINDSEGAWQSSEAAREYGFRPGSPCMNAPAHGRAREADSLVFEGYRRLATDAVKPTNGVGSNNCASGADI